MKYIFGILIILLYVLCSSCATQRGAERYFDRNLDKLDVYIDGNLEYTNEYGAAYAAKYFPPKLSPPEIATETVIVPGRLITIPMEEYGPKVKAGQPITVKCDDVPVRHVTKTIHVRDMAAEEALKVEFRKLENAYMLLKKDLVDMTADRDQWKDKAENRFWAIVAMVVCAVLYLRYHIQHGAG